MMTIPENLGRRIRFFKVARSAPSRMGIRTLACALLCVVFAENTFGQSDLSLSDAVPYGQRAFDYWAPAVSNPVTRLASSIRDRKVALHRDGSTGYLLSVLKQLDIKTTSQLLVFSKTALNRNLIGPKRPRAVYFNDDSMVAWVPEAASLEVAAWDDSRGFVFFTLSQRPPKNAEDQVSIQRERRCLACHAGSSTLHVPGLLRRSSITDINGEPEAGFGQTDQSTPFQKRWGGWYVTGAASNDWHLGSVPGTLRVTSGSEKRISSLKKVELEFALDDYPCQHSNIVAHLVFDHQVRCQNLISRVLIEHASNLKSEAEQTLLESLLFENESRLPEPIHVSNRFRSDFEAQAAVDGYRDSLRRLNLKQRVFEHPLSFVVYSRPFHSLPADVQQRLGKSLHAQLGISEPARSPSELQFRAVLHETAKRMPKVFSEALIGSTCSD